MEINSVVPKIQPLHNATVTLSPGDSIVVDGDLATETIAIKHVGLNSYDMTTAYDNNGNAIVLTSTKTAFVALGYMYIQIQKPTTTNPVGVLVLTDD